MQTYEIIAGYARENNIEKFSVEDVNDTLMEWATTYTDHYQGNFSFMLDMVRAIQQYGKLSLGQAKGVLNCALAEYRYRGPSEQTFSIPVEDEIPTIAPQTVSQPTSVEQKVPNGTYTVVFADQDYRTLRIKDDFRSDAPEGSQMAEYLIGPDNSRDFKGFAFVSGEKVGIWRKFKEDSVLADALRILFEDPEEAGYAYAVQSGNCYRCGRKLTVPESLNRGLGPECAKVIGG